LHPTKIGTVLLLFLVYNLNLVLYVCLLYCFFICNRSITKLEIFEIPVMATDTLLSSGFL